MKKGLMLFVWLILISAGAFTQIRDMPETNLAGVYQGNTLFIQNPYNRQSKSYCIERISINNQPLSLNYKLSAIKLDFNGFDLYTPVNISIKHTDTICSPVIINPEAILFHTIFRFYSVNLTDSALIWNTKGERGIGEFEVQKLSDGIWVTQEMFPGKGKYEGVNYTFIPVLEEGHNKYRIRYNYPPGGRKDHLFSQEIDFDFYPDPVDFKPKSTKERLILSRNSPYKIYNAKSEMVLEGRGSEIDVTILRRGQYVIYFNGKDPGTFTKE